MRHTCAKRMTPNCSIVVAAHTQAVIRPHVTWGTTLGGCEACVVVSSHNVTRQLPSDEYEEPVTTVTCIWRHHCVVLAL